MSLDFGQRIRHEANHINLRANCLAVESLMYIWIFTQLSLSVLYNWLQSENTDVSKSLRANVSCLKWWNISASSRSQSHISWDIGMLIRYLGSKAIPYATAGVGVLYLTLHLRYIRRVFQLKPKAINISITSTSHSLCLDKSSDHPYDYSKHLGARNIP